MSDLRWRRGSTGMLRGLLAAALVASFACNSPRQNSVGEGGGAGHVMGSGGSAGSTGGATGGRGGAPGSGGAAGGQPGSAAGGAPAQASGGSAAPGGGGQSGAGATAGGGGGGILGSGGAGGVTPAGGAGGGPGCPGAMKVCNGACVPLSTCCGGCSGTTPVCGSAGVCVGRDAGTTCGQDSECTTGHCADGVCCNEACTGQCESCATASAKGTCTPVTTPRTPCGGTGACAATCDGTAAHRAACVFPSSSTSCGAAASCASNMATTAALCDGAGSCTAPMTMSCMYGCRTDGTIGCASSCATGTALCGGTSCVDLGQPSHCGPSCQNCTGTMTSKCSGATGGCVACLVNSDCKGSNSVCSSNHTCQCHPRSATNLLTGGNFDSSLLSGWTVTGDVEFGTDDDADGCNPASGYIIFGNGQSPSISQCVNVTGGTTYYLGISYKEPQSNSVFCELNFYTQAGCPAAALAQGQAGNPILGVTALNSWTRVSTQYVAPSNAVSAEYICFYWTGSTQLDQAYLNTSDNY